MMYKYKLHPISALINFLRALKDLMIPIVVLFFANGLKFNFSNNDTKFFGEMLPLLILTFVVLYSFVHGIIKWWTFRYWFVDNEIRVEYGLFIKKKRYIPYERIQSLNYKESIFHRVFGLVQVMVETAGNKMGKAEAELTAISREAAAMIENETRKVKTGTVIEKNMVNVQATNIIHKMSQKDLVVLATTSNSVGVVLAGIVAAISQFAEFIPYEWIYKEIAHLLRFGLLLVAVLVVFALILAWLFSVIITFINYYNFVVTVENNRLAITRGLLEKKRITIPLNRVQAIKIIENPFRQMFGLATVVVESAGGGFSGEKDKRIVLFPLISKKEMILPLQQLFPDYDFTIIEMIQPPKKAQPFFYRVDFLWVIPIICLLTYFFFPYGLLSLLVILPVISLGIWQYKTARFKIIGDQITIMYRSFSRITFFAQKHRIQVAQRSQSFFQKKKGVASAKVIVMSGMSGAVAKAYNMNDQDIDTIMHWFKRT